MTNKKHIESEIIRMRQALKLQCLTDSDKEKLWCSMLTLQWVISSRPSFIGPIDICIPSWKRHGLNQLIKRKNKK